ncbi:3-hydroxyacyl-CoA dehydrogenase/enoyl-CoA hydratase family protein [Phnomibacter ginsenosidimutans]|uniref:3-hydroxyacyl-CoA dehydrogenase/enoyl-CoA hydratase family protein n=1 Tax=Phnomibacter ginsenosidimutans TaxID=2676868 RepID=UPI001FE28449|nr:3-hydroxyacyl-CoA dehydrogenase/enoyl-CoA hydratase family protein [Phnomibacter ginsenosidimutans]
MNRSIKKVAVLGSGVMGSRIACHFAGIGLPVLLLDMVPKEATESTKPAERNKLVNDALAAALKSNPSPVFTKSVAKKITTGNFTDNMKDIAQCDWVIEVVVERLDIKQLIYEQVEKYRKPGTLITSNTSGIPIHMLSQGRSEDFRQHFCGTHFFNPPRYLRLLEIIPTPDTDPAIVDFLMHYGDLYLGKTTVLCKDTPAFIANRIGVFSMMAIMRVMEQQGLTTDEIDALTGPAIGRPKSATFRTADVVGIDTLVKVAQGVAANCPNDEAKDIFTIPAWLEKMVAANMLGDKTKGGFFKMDKSGGKKEILTLNLQTLEYGAKVKPKFASIEAGKQIDDLRQRIKMLVAAPDKAGEFYRAFHHHLFSYISHRIPEISDELYRVDDAMMAGFGWEIGAFETWDLLGVAKTTDAMKAAGFSVAAWVEEFIAAGNKTFYKVENGKRLCYDVASKTYKLLPGGDNFIILSDLKEKTVWKNSACTLVDMGDDVLGLSWSTKMNTIGGDVLAGIQKSVAIAEEKYKGLVIANEGANFSLGANVGLIFMYAIDQEYDELDMAVRMFQNTSMRLRYSSVPVVVAPHGMALGGGCEFSLHADKIQAAAETYIGLVELGVGLIPGGGGTKEFALRAGDEYFDGEIEMEALKRRFFTIGMAKVATSAYEGYELGILRKGIDEVSMNINRRVADAKRSVLEMYNEGYVQARTAYRCKSAGPWSIGCHAGRPQWHAAGQLHYRTRCEDCEEAGLRDVRRRPE